MSTTDAFLAGLGLPGAASAPSGLLDLLSLAAVVLDDSGRIVFWSPQAEELFGYTAEEALGTFAGRLLVEERHLETVIELFARVMQSGQRWSGSFPVLHRDGSTRLVEFRNMRLQDDHGGYYALGIATDQATLQRVERDLALSIRLVSQSPIGLGVMDTELRYVLVNPVLARVDGLPADAQVGRVVSEALPFANEDSIESDMRRVLATGIPLLDRFVVGRTPDESDQDHAWSVSFYRLEDPGGQVLGLATSVVDVTEQHRAATDAARARHRLALVADASVRVGTTLDLGQTARELAEVCVPQVADVATVDVLDSILHGHRSSGGAVGAARFRALAVVSAHPTVATHAVDPTGDYAQYDANRLITQCVNTRRPVLKTDVTGQDLRRVARDDECAALLAAAGVHSYLAVPLIARGEVIGAVGLMRADNPRPFDEDDVVLAGELAARAAVCIDNARLFQSQRHAALTLQRSLLPERPADQPGLKIATRYQPAGATSEIGGDWFDVIPLADDKTALVIGDVMGSGIDAAATMGQLRTSTRTLTQLDLDPDQVLHYLDRATAGIEHTIATCAYAVFNPATARATSRWPGTCRRSSCDRAAPPNCSTCPPALRSAWAGSPSVPPASASPPVTSWSCTRMAWSRPATRPSTIGWISCCPCSRVRTAISRRPATCSCGRFAGPATTMTWPCSSPGCPPRSPETLSPPATPAPGRRPSGSSRRRAPW